MRLELLVGGTRGVAIGSREVKTPLSGGERDETHVSDARLLLAVSHKSLLTERLTNDPLELHPHMLSYENVCAHRWRVMLRLRTEAQSSEKLW